MVIIAVILAYIVSTLEHERIFEIPNLPTMCKAACGDGKERWQINILPLLSR